MKELIEKELIRQGYIIHQWRDTLKHGWGIEVEKNGYYTTIFIDEIVGEMITEEMKNEKIF